MSPHSTFVPPFLGLDLPPVKRWYVRVCRVPFRGDPGSAGLPLAGRGSLMFGPPCSGATSDLRRVKAGEVGTPRTGILLKAF